MLPSDYTIKIRTFKPNGKWYNDNFCDQAETYIQLSKEHQKLQGYQLTEILKANGPDVQQYATLLSGIGGGFYHTVEVVYPKDIHNFCMFSIDCTGS